MSSELTKPKYSKCPAKCKIGNLAPNVIDEIDVAIAQGYRLEDIVDRFPLALLTPLNVASHKKKHLDIAKILLEFQQQGIKVLDSNNKPQTVEDEVESIKKQNPELAEELKKLGSSGELPFKSIDLVIERIIAVRKVISELYALPSVPHRICALYEQVMQRWVDIYAHLCGDFDRLVDKQSDASTVSSWIIKEAKKREEEKVKVKDGV